MLVAIAIPVFTSQLEKSREATDQANLRSAYAEVIAKALEDPDNDHAKTITTKQTTAGWLTAPEVAGVTLTDSEAPATGDVEVKYTASTGKVTIGSVEVQDTVS